MSTHTQTALKKQRADHHEQRSLFDDVWTFINRDSLTAQMTHSKMLEHGFNVKQYVSDA